MKVIEDIKEMQTFCLATRENGNTITFVPTMGYLHDGHLSLLQAARDAGDLLVLSIFVNPAQFGAGEDFENYPRDLSRDADLAASCGVDVIFVPRTSDMYPRNYATFVDVERLTDTLCGRSRPGHFRGVTTVVAKLFAIVQPHVAFFGQKDFQQLAVIRRMTADLNFPVEIRGLPIIREDDGLAMSSRNVYLSSGQRHQALALIDGIRRAAAMVRAGEIQSERVIENIAERIRKEPEAAIDYIQICHRDTLEDLEMIDENAIVLLAVRIGETRLIDNYEIGEDIKKD